jgi:GT2 family glycosyltransferase
MRHPIGALVSAAAVDAFRVAASNSVRRMLGKRRGGLHRSEGAASVGCPLLCAHGLTEPSLLDSPHLAVHREATKDIGARPRIPTLQLPLTHADQDAISVVISTYQRPDACERALRSVLRQTELPREVLVCDNGSTDDTEARMRAWERRDQRIRYVRTSQNSGTPSTTRNLGVEQARGEFVAFLDDDDEWLPDKLAAQRVALATESADAVATNALRSDGSIYFPDARASWRPTPTDLLWANPIIASSALVRRDLLLSAGGFPTELRLKGLEDYATWLELASRGARFLVLGDALVRYDDSSGDRLSRDRARIEMAVARLAWGHAFRAPVRRAEMKAALRRSVGAVHVSCAEAWTAVRAGAGAVRRGRSPLNRGVGR